jgi:hypothetical protein
MGIAAGGGEIKQRRRRAQLARPGPAHPGGRARSWVLPLVVLLVGPFIVADAGASSTAPIASILGDWSSPDPTNPSGAVVLDVSSESRVTGQINGTVRFDVASAAQPGGTLPIEGGEVRGSRFQFSIELPGTVAGRSGYRAIWTGVSEQAALRITIAATRWGGPAGPATTTTTIRATRSGPIVSISGTIELACSSACTTADLQPLVDVEVEADGAQRYTAVTNAAGRYAFSVPAGHYRLIPEEPELTFDPSNRLVSGRGPFASQNFIGCDASGVVPQPALRPAAMLGCPSAVLTARIAGANRSSNHAGAG